MIKYGLISETDGRTLEKTIDLICKEFVGEVINVTEIGVYNGETGSGIREYFIEKRTNPMVLTGIDNEKDKPIENKDVYYNFILGNSNEVYNQLEDESQHLIFIDGLHTFAGVISDFFCYAPKVKVGGFLAFHDTGKHLDPLSGWQGVGDKNDPDMCLGGVRRALEEIGLYKNDKADWRLIFDEADVNDTGGGISVFKKVPVWD